MTLITKILRLWVLVTGLAGLGASLGAYMDPGSPYKTLYRNSEAAGDMIFSRMYATWLLLSTVVRVTFAVTCSITPSLYMITLATYIIALWHFGLEIFVFESAPLQPGGLAPLTVASVSIIALLFSRKNLIISGAPRTPSKSSVNSNKRDE